MSRGDGEQEQGLHRVSERKTKTTDSTPVIFRPVAGPPCARTTSAALLLLLLRLMLLLLFTRATA